MQPAVQSHIFDVFDEYSRLYKLRNETVGGLSPELQKEWAEVNFTLESIFSGLYRPDGEYEEEPAPPATLREKLPVKFLRVPTDADVLCETRDTFFSGKLQDISVGGAYVHSPVPFQIDSPVRLTFCTFRDQKPLELEGRIAWNNPGSLRKSHFPEGAGVEFTSHDNKVERKLQEYVYELVENTLTRANLL
jgi:Tfp pilus assembly protein PilZ